MNKEQKQAAVKEIGEQLEASSAVFAVDYRGISVPQAAELRAKLRDADASFTVVKNRLAKRVIGESGAEALDEHLVGPTALTYVRGDAVTAAKTIADFTKANNILTYKGGIMDGEPLGSDEFTTIARLPGVDVLRGQLVGLAASPLSGLVGTLNAFVSGLASQLGQIADQGLVSGEPPAAEEAPAEEAPADVEPDPDTAPGTGGEEDVEAPAEDAGESDNPGGDTDVVPEAAEETSDDETETEQSDQGDDAESDADESKED